MKTAIYITGSISGNFKLLSKMIGYREYSNIQFNGFKLLYDTKKSAQKDLSEAFQRLRSDVENKSCITYSRGYALSYDASRARIDTI